MRCGCRNIELHLFDLTLSVLLNFLTVVRWYP